MPQTPIPRDTVIELRNADDADPETSIDAFMVPPEDIQANASEVMLGNSFGAELIHFVGLVHVYAQFHSLKLVNNTRYTDGELYG